MIRGRCPICQASFQGATLRNLPHFPFCSERCRMVDLGRWIQGDYVIPGASPTTVEETEAEIPSSEKPDPDTEE